MRIQFRRIGVARPRRGTNWDRTGIPSRLNDIEISDVRAPQVIAQTPSASLSPTTALAASPGTPVIDRDRRALADKRQRDLAPGPIRAARGDCNPALQIQIHCYSPCTRALAPESVARQLFSVVAGLAQTGD